MSGLAGVIQELGVSELGAALSESSQCAQLGRLRSRGCRNLASGPLPFGARAGARIQSLGLPALLRNTRAAVPLP